MNRLHRASLIRFVALAITVVVGTMASDASATRIKVRGTTRIAARASRGVALDAGATNDPTATKGARSLVIEGTVEDDVGTRLVGERVELRATGATEGHKVRLDEAGAAMSCDPTPLSLGRQGDAVTTTTDGQGRFCMRLVLPVEHYVLKLTTAGAPLIDPGVLDLAVDLARRSVGLRFDGVPHRLSLDKDEHTIVGVASFEDDDVRVAAEQLPLTLTSGSGTIVGHEVTGTGGRATFKVLSSALGEPGLSQLHLSFPGDEEAAAANAVLSIEKRAKVALALGKPVEPTTTPEDGVPIQVVLSTRTQTVPAGVVEARIGETVVGAAPVRDGRAQFTATFAVNEPREVTMSIRFLPEAPWWDAPDALTVRVPVTGGAPWRKVSLVLAGILVAAFIVLGRVGRVRSVPRAPKSIRGAAVPRAGVAVLEAATDPRAGWVGRVVDAHDRSLVVGARVAIENADFQGTHVLASTFADDAGSFTLPPVAVSAASRPELIVDAPLHTSLRKALPPAGTIEVALVSRKRALLDRLVEWARMRGKPFDVRPEPTPGHIRKAAIQDSPPARWADAIEAAAFGPDPVDGRVEAEIEALRPDAPPQAKGPALPVGQTKER